MGVRQSAVEAVRHATAVLPDAYVVRIDGTDVVFLDAYGNEITRCEPRQARLIARWIRMHLA